MRPRRRQTPITIRSDRAAARLALLTRGGRSQAEVIEEALEKAAAADDDPDDTEAFLAELEELSRRAMARTRIPTMEEFDEATYDERGLLR